MTKKEKRAFIKNLGRISTLLVFIGIISLCQPVSFTLFKFGFPITFTGTVLGMVLGYIKV